MAHIFRDLVLVGRYRFFPNIYSFLIEIKHKGTTQSTQYKDLNNKYGSCQEDDVDRVAESFLSNQKRMSQISKAYGFTHFLILQPNFNVHSGALNRGYYRNDSYYYKILGKKSGFMMKVIKNIMSSEYCSNNPCLDLSSVFDNMGFFLETYDSIKNNPDLVEKWLVSGVFVDQGHFNDKGNEIVAGEINNFINLYNLRGEG